MRAEGVRAGQGLRRFSLAVLLVWLVLPLVPVALWSVAHGWRFPAVLPQAWSGWAWAYALSPRSGVVQSLALTVWIAALTAALSALIGVPAGRALGLMRVPGRAAAEVFLLAPVLVPGIAVALGLHAVFIRLGLTNTVTGVVLVHLVPALPYMTLIMAGVFAGFDTDFEAQARTLGATRAQTFRHVTLPAILPGLMVGALMTFLVSWGQYVLTLTIGGGKVITLPLFLYSAASSGRNDITGAVGMVSMLPGLVILLFVSRRLSSRGLAAGPVAGAMGASGLTVADRL